MVKCKYDAWDTRVKYPHNMSRFKKTTMGKYYNSRTWRVLEDRRRPEDYGQVRNCEFMVVFLQEPKDDRWGHAFYCTNRNINFDDEDDT
eukprot:6049293-Karenia_brevis.AAC.1